MLKIELFYITKGAKKVVNDIEEFNATLHYVEMPFLVTIKPVNKFEFDIGFAVSYLISSKFVQGGYEIDEELHNMHDMDFGGVITGSYFFSEKLGINVRFEYSVKPIKTDPHIWYNSNMSFGVIYKIL
ncbi:MAG: PorT family protein [Chloroflexia bacterium]|nr:PorT family protein [Chloroflexia bacterium]